MTSATAAWPTAVDGMVGAVVRGKHVPGDALLHPLALLALTLLLLNDHVLKSRFPGFVTGKLSDVAAMVFCPFLVAALYEVARWVFRRPSRAMPVRFVVLVCLVVGLGFALMKISVTVGDSYGREVGRLRGLVTGEDAAVQIAPDVSDVIAAPFVAFAGWALILRQKKDLHSSQM